MGKDIKGLECLTSRRWWNAAGTRAIRTLAQAAIGAFAVNSIWEIDLHEIAGIAAVSALASLLMSLETIPDVTPENER